MTTELQVPSLAAAVAAEQTHLQVPSRPEWIPSTVEYLRDKALRCGACQEAGAGRLELALHEALTNAVVHGNLELPSELKEQSENAFAAALAARSADPHYGSRSVEIHVDYDGERCRWAFTDQGKGFNVERVLARAEGAVPETLLSSGRGILLMRAFVDEVRYELGGRRVILALDRACGPEKRQKSRWPLQRPVRVAPVRADGTPDWEAAYEAVSRNLSPDGMAILQSRLATTGRVLIGLDWGGRMLYLPAEVRHCQARGGDMMEIGCRFQVASAGARAETRAEEAGQAVGQLLDRLTSSARLAEDQRAHPRAAYTARMDIYLEPDGEPLAGFARDLSRGGMSFLTTAPLPLEEVVLSLPQPDAGALRLLARIVRCNPLVNGIFDVGARFLDLSSERGASLKNAEVRMQNAE